jgi:HTH-type transcriptional regulator/antitoxin HigA
MRASDKNPMEKVSIYTWAMRVLQLCDQQKIPRYNPDKFNDLLDHLLKLSRNVKDIINVPTVLMEAGIHFVVVPHLQKTYLDGAAFMGGGNEPIIAMTLRYNRVDYFWFSLFHEIGHLFSGLKCIEGAYYDNMQELNLKDKAELQANQYAANWLVDPHLLIKFVKNTPQLTADAITEFALSINRHPSIVLGQLQHQELIGYNQCRKLHENQVRYFLAPYITA